MNLKELTKRVQPLLSDPDGTFCDDAYVSGFLPTVYEDLQNKLGLTSYQFNESEIELPGVIAGSPNLDSYQQVGQPLFYMIRPTIIEWKLPGQDNTYYQEAQGPLDEIIDLPAGVPYLDDWAFIQQSVKLSNFSIALDLRVTGIFMLDPLTDPDQQIKIAPNVNVVLTYMLAEAAASERGNQAWILRYGAKADETLDDLALLFVRAQQGRTRRVARMSRRTLNSNPFNTGF